MIRAPATAALFALAACGPAEPPPEDLPVQVEHDTPLSHAITYVVSGGQRPARAVLTLGRDGRGRLELGTHRSLPAPPADRVGLFEGPAGEANLLAVDALIAREGLAGRRAPPAPGMPGMVRRSLVLDDGGAKNALGLGPPDPALDALETLLVKIMRGLLEHPARAVEMDASASSITLRGVGREPVALMLFDPDKAGRYLRVTRGHSDSQGAATRAVIPRAHIAGLVGDGQLQAGVIELAPGATIEVPLPALALGAGPGALTVNASFYLAGPGPARSVAELEVGPILLD